MMGLYLTEDEQLNLIRNWFKKYGKLTLLSFTVFLVVFFGIRAWQDYKNTQTEKASILYERMLLNNQDHKKIDYPAHQNTPYGQLVILLEAKNAIDQGDFTTATDKLNWVINHTHNQELQQISRIRLARVLFAQNKPELALKQLKKVKNATFNSLVDAVKERKTINPTAPLKPVMQFISENQ